MKQSMDSTSTNPVKSSNGHWIAPGKAAEIQEQLTETAKQIYDKLMEGATKSLSQANRKTQNLVRRYPLQTAAGALLVGILFGAAISRRRA